MLPSSKASVSFFEFFVLSFNDIYLLLQERKEEKEKE